MQPLDKQQVLAENPDGSVDAAPRLTAAQIAVVVVRHLVPVAMVLFFNGSASQFLLLSIFNIAFTVSCIGGLGVTVSAQKKEASHPGRKHSSIVSPRIVAAVLVVTIILTVVLGWWIVPIAAQQGAPLFTRSLGLSAAMIVIAAVPALRYHFVEDMNSPLTERERMNRDRSNAGTLFLSGVLIFMMINLSLVLTMLGTVALFIVADLRPDLIRVPFRRRTPAK